MNKGTYILTRIIHAITGILLLYLGCYYLYWGLKPIDDNEKSLRGLMVIPGVVCLLLTLIPLLSLWRIKIHHSKTLHYLMGILSLGILVYIVYTYLTE